MIGTVFAIVGFLSGYMVARRRGGNRLDRLQYGAGFAFASGLFGALLHIALDRYFGLP